jgi:hypothetical protein
MQKNFTLQYFNNEVQRDRYEFQTMQVYQPPEIENLAKVMNHGNERRGI